MSQTGPWSVKGIDQRARDAAREAASAEGLTLGEYLNNLLMASDGPQPNEISAPFEQPQPTPDAASSTLDRLTRRIEATEARSTLAITGMDQTVLGLVARLENAEQNGHSIAGHVESLIDELKETHEALQSKVRRLEEDDSAKQNLDALKSLEVALGKLASHVYEENEMAQNETQAIKGRVEAGFSDLNDRVEGIETKIESKLTEAAARLERSVEQAETRVEGTTRHLSDRMTSLEANLNNKLASVTKSDERLDAMEADVSGALDSMENTLLRIQDRLNRAESTTDTALKSLEATFDHLDKRIEEVSKQIDPELAGKLRTEFEARFDDMTKSVRSMIETTRTELADEITRTATSVTSEEISELKDTLADVNERIARAELANSETSALATSELQRISDELTAKIADVEMLDAGMPAAEVLEEISKTEARSAEAIEKVGESLSGRIDTLSEEVSQRISESEAVSAETIEKVGSNITEKMSGLADEIDGKIADSELRSATAIEQIGDQVASAAARLQKRQDEAIKAMAAQMDEDRKKADTRLSEALTNVSERLETMQSQSSNALSPVQKAIASLATRLESLEEFSQPPFVQATPAVDIPDVQNLTSNEPLFSETKAEEISFTFDDIQSAIEGINGDMPDNSSQTESEEDLNPVETDAGVEQLSISMETDAVDDRTSNIAVPEPADKGVAVQSDGFDTAGAAAASFSDIASIIEENSIPAQETETKSEWHVSEELNSSEYDDPYNEDFSDIQEEPLSFEQIEGFEEVSETEIISTSDNEQFDDLDDSHIETRESDIFDEDAPVAPNSVEESDVVAEKPAESENYLTMARRAALAAADSGDTAIVARSRKKSKKKKGKATSTKASNPTVAKMPMAVAASVVVATGIGVSGYLYLRGKQPPPPSTASSTYVDPMIASATLETSSAPDDSLNQSADDILFDEPDIAAIESDLFDAVEAESTEETVEVAALESSTVSTVVSAEFPAIPRTQTVDSAAAAGNHIAQYQLAQDHIQAGNYQAGAELMRKAAAKGLPVAMYGLAKLHESGNGVAKDFAMAREWTLKAAEAGNVNAMHNMGIFLAQGEGGSQSYAGAAEWFRKASDYGKLDSQFNLAVLYQDGLGVSKNMTEALFWYEIAAQNGDAAAPEQVAAIKAIVSEDVKKTVAARVATWQPSTESGLANGKFGAQPWNASNPLQVKAVQTALSALGYDAGEPDGVLGAGTSKAIKAYQADKGLDQSGKITDELIDSLNSQATATT